MTVTPECEERAAWPAWPGLAGRLRRLAGPAEFAKVEPWLRRYGLEWRNLTREMRFTPPDGAEPLLALWLSEPVEQAVDQAWRASPGNAFWLDRLAAELCMAELRRRFPEKRGLACAPVPPASAGLLAVLREAGLAKPAGPAGSLACGSAPLLTRRYAVLTYERARGCAACALRAGCPKL